MKFLEFIGLIVSGIASTLLKAWVFSTLWMWFIVTTFRLPELTHPVAIGIMTCITLLTYTSARPSKDEGALAFVISMSYTVPLICLLIGYAAHKFI